MKTILHIPTGEYIGNFYSEKEANRFMRKWSKNMNFLLEHFQNADIKRIWSSKYFVFFSTAHIESKIKTARFFDALNRLCDKLDHKEIALRHSISLYLYLYPTGDIAPINKKEFTVVLIKEQIK